MTKLSGKAGVDAFRMDRVDAVLGRDDLFADALDAVVDEELGIGQAADVLAHQVGELGADLLDAGHQSQTDLVAQVFGRAVGGVLAEGDVPGDGILQNVLARGEQERSDQFAHVGADAGQSRSPVPRSRLMKKVSIESSMWWAMAITV